MKYHTRLLRWPALGLVSIPMLLLPVTAAAQAGRIRATHTAPGANPGAAAFGSVIVAAGDVNGDSRSDYAIAAPAGAGGAGQVQMFSGANTSLLWTITGAAGDALGSSMTSIPDITGDGKPDMMIGAPGAAVPGQIVFVDGLNGSTLTAITNLLPLPPLAMTLLETELDTALPDGRPELIVLDGSNVSVVSSGLLHPPAPNTPLALAIIPLPSLAGETTVVAAGDFFGTGSPTCVALGAPSLDQVRVLDMATGQQAVFKSKGFFGAAGNLLGTSLARDIDGDRVLAGAPGAFGNIGSVVQISKNGSFIVAVGTFTFSALGLAVSAGNVDGSAAFVAGGASLVKVFLKDGTQQNVFGSIPFSFTFGSGIACVGDTNQDGFDDFVVGDSPAPNGGRADVFFGGPTATINNNFGLGCSPIGVLPQLTLPAPLSLGAPFALNVANGQLSLVAIFMGAPNAAGTPIPGLGAGCTSWLTNQQAFPTFATDSLGNAVFISPQVVPVNASLLGLSFGFQDLVQFFGVPTLAVSNAVVGKVGW